FATGKELVRYKLDAHTDIQSLTFSPDGRYVASGTRDGVIDCRPSDTGQAVPDGRFHQQRITSVAFSPDGRTVATGSYDRKVRLWGVATGRPTKDLSRDSGHIFDLAFSPGGGRLFGVETAGWTTTWNVGPEAKDVTFNPAVVQGTRIAFLPGGKEYLCRATG